MCVAIGSRQIGSAVTPIWDFGLLRRGWGNWVADQAAEMTKRNDRIEALLTKLSEDVTAVRIQLRTARRQAETPAAH